MRRERQEATKPRPAPDAWPQCQRPLAERAHFVSMASPRPRRRLAHEARGLLRFWRVARPPRGRGEGDGVRLVVTRGSRNVWARLEPETTEEILALEACAARGEWTNGRGTSGIATLRALAARLGYPVEAPVRRGAASPPPRLVVVRQGNLQLHERLTAIARRGITVIWDRRQAERRATERPAAVDRRRKTRRRPTPETWSALGFLVVQAGDASP